VTLLPSKPHVKTVKAWKTFKKPKRFKEQGKTIMSTQEQVGCIFCGRSALKSRINLEALSTNYSIDWNVLQVRACLAGPGAGKKGKNASTGWPRIEAACKSIVELAEDPAYTDLVEAIKSRLIMITRAYIQAGIIKKEELI